MNVEKLFQVLVVTGATATAGLGCSDGGDDDDGAGGTAGMGGSSGASAGGAAGSGATGGTGGGGDACEAACMPNATAPDMWTDCNGCCCWLPAGSMSPVGPICGEEPCCEGRGR